MMGIGNYWDGIMKAELTSADILTSLKRIQTEGVRIWDLETPDGMTLCFSVRRRDWKTLCSMVEKRGDRLRIMSQKGLYWDLLSLKSRPILILGLGLLLLLCLWVPGKVLFIQVEGNSNIASRQILETAAQCGIHFGVSRREVRSENMKNALLEAMPSLSWAGVNTYGCTAVITVRERTQTQPPNSVGTISSIVAERDGVIRQLTVLRGKALCTAGQAVKAGQVLISAYTDCDLSIQAQQAQGEIFALTNRSLTAVCPLEYRFRGNLVRTERKFSLIIGKNRINFTNSSGISGATCAKIYEENYISLPGGFVLPVAIAVETWSFYESQEQELVSPQQLLQGYAEGYLLSRMRSGSILDADISVLNAEGVLQLTGRYYCHEMIGITRIEENIPDYVKND